MGVTGECRLTLSEAAGKTQAEVTALGGNLELVAGFGNKRIVVAGAQTAPSVGAPARKTLQRTIRSTAHR